jgi:hypothetical protein
MAIRLSALALVYFLLFCGSAYAQTDYAELYPLPPIAEEPIAAEPDLQAPSNENGRIPRLVAPGSTGAWQDFLNEGHFYYGGELIVFKTSWGPSFEDDRLAASRYRLGWEHESGVGLRARYLTLESNWNVNNGPSGAPIIDPDPGDIDSYAPYYEGSLLLGREIDNLNLDLYKRFMVGETELLIGSGLTTVRNIERFQRVFDTGSSGGSYSYDFTDDSLKGVGVGLVGELRRPIFVRDTTEVSFLLNGRSSYIPVEMESQSQLVNFARNDDLWVHEGHIGVELQKRLDGLTLILRGQYEVQHWDMDLADNRGFDGVGFSVGLGW